MDNFHLPHHHNEELYLYHDYMLLHILYLINVIADEYFQNEYQILLIFDDTTISRGVTVDKIVKEVQRIKQQLHRSYVPTIEILTINSDAGHDIYSETHDRRILSNYFLLSATRGFSAFIPPRGSEDEMEYAGITYPTWKQKLYFGIQIRLFHRKAGQEPPFLYHKRSFVGKQHQWSRSRNGFHQNQLPALLPQW